MEGQESKKRDIISLLHNHVNDQSEQGLVEVTDGILAQACLTVGPVGPQTHPVITSPVLECKIGTDILSSWQNPHVGLLLCGVRAIMVGKVK